MRSSDLKEQTSAEEAADLVHSVGKYVSRTARNLPKGEIPPGLVELFIEDVFKTDGARTALEVFDELASSSSLLDEPRIDKCRALLERIAAMEPGIRAGQAEAVRGAAAMTLEVDAELRALAGEKRGIEK